MTYQAKDSDLPDIFWPEEWNTEWKEFMGDDQQYERLTPDQLKALVSLMVGTEMRIEDARRDLGYSRLHVSSVVDLNNLIAWCSNCSKWNYLERFVNGVSCCEGD